ncbi:protease modulator HflC [Algicola sagamiensis]|uniref:protease modulator HflC n=1 Tax=Algicola sagamiensis TaxID=163869 RepID=UPI0004757ECD|nr:protease modulator HflC [Algicola sagamiensis]
MKTLILLFAVLLTFLSSIFVVKEGERGIVIQFGKVLRVGATEKPQIFEPGLHFKIPFINRVEKIDARLQTLDDEAGRFVTSEKKDLIVDSYVKWRVSDFAQYYLSTRAQKGNAESLLKQKVNNGLRTEFGTRTIREIVSGERSELMEEAMEQAQKGSGDLGIEIVDVRVKQINLPEEVSNSIYKRMRTEREVVAKEHRSQGREKAEVIKAGVDKKITLMLAQAQKDSLTLRGEGDAIAAKTYADAFSKSPEFYSFVRSLDAYKKSFNTKSDVMVIEPDSDFFRYMKDARGKQ